MSWQENLRKMIERATVRVDRGIVHVDFGEVPMNDQATLIFPKGTQVHSQGKEWNTMDGEEFSVSKWCSGADMTWGYLQVAGNPYFKALDYPIEVRERDIVQNLSE